MGRVKQTASGPLTEQEIRANMKAFAAFMARMIEKYGADVLAEIEAEAAGKQGADNTTEAAAVTVASTEVVEEAGP